MAFDVHETSKSGKRGSVQLIDLTEEETEAPFAVREADGSAHAVPGRLPDKATILAWLEDHPVMVGVATGVLCFAIIAAAMSVVLGSNTDTDSGDPVAGAASSETDGSQGSFSAGASEGSNFTSESSKLSRTGAGKNSGEAAAGTNSDGSSNPNSRSGDRTADGSLNLTSDDAGRAGNTNPNTDLNARANGPRNNSGPAARPGSSTTRPAGSAAITLNPGPNVSGSIPITGATSQVTTPGPATTGQTTATTGGQTQSSTPSSSPTSPSTTTATTQSTTASTAAAPVALSITSPGYGTRHSYETATSFTVNSVPGATQYCWSFIQGGVTKSTNCTTGTSYQLPASPGAIAPGLVTVKVTATGSSGTSSDSILISLHRSHILNNPTQDLVIGRGALRVGVVNMSGATSYCFRVTQAGYNSGDLCYSQPVKTFNKQDPIWDSLSPGPLTVAATVSGGGITLATDSVTIQLLEP